MPCFFSAWITESFPAPEGAESTNRSPCLVGGCVVIFCCGTAVSSGIFSSCSSSERPIHHNMLTGCRSTSIGCGDRSRHGQGNLLWQILYNIFSLCHKVSNHSPVFED